MKDEIERKKAESIYTEYSNFVYRTALFLTKSKELADDVTQETFIQVFQKYATYDSSKPLQPWLYKIAVNTTRNMLRKQKWLKFWGQIPESHSLNLMESSILKNEEESELWQAVNDLSFNSREIIVLHFYAGLKLTEISDCLGIPLGTCKSRLNSALNKLRRSITHHDFEFLLKGGGTIEASKQ